MSKKKERLLNKYLDKKRKQRKRDDILAQIAEIEQKRAEKIRNIENDEAVKKSKIDDSEINTAFENKYIKDDLKDELKDESKDESESKDTVKDEIDDVKDKIDDVKDKIDDVKDKIDDVKDEIDDVKDESEEFYDLGNAEKIPIFDKFVEPESINKLEPDLNNNEENTDSNYDEELDLEDFLGEKVHWENVKCLNRPPDIEEFRKQLPIYYEKSDIISKIRNNTVTIIKGETGCGKTTQIPQFLYEGGFKKLIGVTQPRRISTISISNRINVELGENKSGYQIRYESTVNEQTAIKIMTDGILLKEIKSDFLLSKYSVIILDEIHERSANMDILISLLSRILKIRKERNDELKLILMSATSMVNELGKFFDKISSIEVSSNSHRVSIFYEDKDPKDIVQASYDRISKIIKAKKNQGNDSILCFLPDKNDIYNLLNKLSERFDDCVVLPLHSSLSKQEQSLIYRKYDQRKIILSTNIAETSITIPDIYYVVDSGLIKTKNVGSSVIYSVEYISKSSALQRAGRAGRTGPGICYRLYTGNIYSRFEELNTPQILNCPLDEIILDLVSLGIKDIYKFPFVNRPTNENIKKSLNDLKRMGILNSDQQLTKLGKYISNLPLPPRIGKLLCIPNTMHILTELIDLACLMSIDIEIRKNGSNKIYFASEKSDLLVILKILRDFEKDKNKKDFCKRMGLNFTTFIEILKMQKFMYSKFNLKDKNILTNDIKNELRKIIYLVYLDKVALPYDSSYWYKKSPVYLSESSIETVGEYVVFEYLVKGTKRIYMKNVTVIEKEWFS